MTETNRITSPVINRSSTHGNSTLQARASVPSTLIAGWSHSNDSSRNPTDVGLCLQGSLKSAMDKWIGVQLGDTELQVLDMSIDLKDGIRILKLLSSVAKEDMTIPAPSCTRSSHISNVANAIEFLKRRSKNSFPSVKSEDIVDGDLNATLALICFILLEYQLQHVLDDPSIQTGQNSSSLAEQFAFEGSSLTAEIFSNQFMCSSSKALCTSFDQAKSALRYWAQAQLDVYITAGLMPPIQDLSHSWSSGIAFSLLIHRHDPSLITDLDFLFQESGIDNDQHWRKTISMALGTARQYMLIPQYAEPEELMASATSEYIVMLYINDFYRIMSKVQAGESKIISHIKTQIQQATISLTRRNVIIPTHKRNHIASRSIQTEQSIAPPKTPETPLPDSRRREHTHRQLMQSASATKTKHSFTDQEHNAAFIELLDHATSDLESVRKLIENSQKTPSDDLLQELSQCIEKFKPYIFDIYRTFRDSIEQQPQNPRQEIPLEQMNSIFEQYNLVCEWMEQVQIRLVESERIKTWIGDRISLIQNEKTHRSFDPLSSDFSMSMKDAAQMHDECVLLAKDIENFDLGGLSRLKAQMKSSTLDPGDEELGPAGTSTIEIALTALEMLNHLTRLLDKKLMLTKSAKLRVKWEDLFVKAVQWVASVDAQLSQFLDGKARWTDTTRSKVDDVLDTEFDYEYRGGVEEAIRILVDLEYRITEFDQGDYSHVLDAYQEIEDMNGTTLPDHMERRQLGFENAFEDLMKRCEFSRKVVEQHLAMIDAMCQFKQLRDEGEQLQQTMIEATEYTGQSLDDGVYADRVQLFKKNTEDLIDVLISRIPYPACPEMLTAMGEFDSKVNEEANETISSTINACKTSLSLLVDSLEQLLSSQTSLSPQQCARMAMDELNRLIDWVDGCKRTLCNLHFDVFTSGRLLEDVDEARLEKERELIAISLDEKEEEIISLIQAARILQLDTITHNDLQHPHVIDGDGLKKRIDTLESKYQGLKNQLEARGLEFDIVKARTKWEEHWAKTNQLLLSIARKIWDFITKRARYDVGRDRADKQLYMTSSEIQHAFQTLQSRVDDFAEGHMAILLEKYQSFLNLVYKFDEKTEVPQQIKVQQLNLVEKHTELIHLSEYANKVMMQRASAAEFSSRLQDCQHEGERIRDSLAKMIRRPMDQYDITTMEVRVKLFKDEIDNISKDYVKSMIYPTFTGDALRSLNQTEAHTAAVSNAQVKELMHSGMNEIRGLDNQVNELFQTYKEAQGLKVLILQYEAEATALREWIEERVSDLKRRQIDVASETLDLSNNHIANLYTDYRQTLSEVQAFEDGRVKNFHGKITELVKGVLQEARSSTFNANSTTQGLELVMGDLSLLKGILSGHSIVLDAVQKRMTWDTKLREGINYLETMHEQLRQFTIKKSNWLSQDELSSTIIAQLEMDLEKMNQQKKMFTEQTMPAIQTSYDEYVDYFPRLPRPVATPDHVEAQMENLLRSVNRYQESFCARSNELELMKQCLSWEKAVRQALVALADEEYTFESLMGSKVRWNPDLDAIQFDKVQLRNEFEDLENQAETRLKRITEPLKERYDELSKRDSMYNVNLVSEVLTRKKQDLVNSEDRIIQAMAFWEEVFAQRCLVCAFISKAETLMRSAETLREDMLTPRRSPWDTSELQLLRFSEEVNTLRQELAAAIPYPLRSTDNVASRTHLDDEATNALVQETITMHNTRLDELVSSLQLILDSKDRLSRRKLSIHSYTKQAEACNTWIRLRRDSICNSRSSTTAHGVTQLKEAVKTAESVEYAMAAKNNALASLELALEKCKMEYIDERPGDESEQEEIVSIQQSHEQLKCGWNDLRKEASEFSKTVTVDLALAELKERLEKLVDNVRKLRFNIEKAEPLYMSDEQVSGWYEAIAGQVEIYTSIQSALEYNPHGMAEAAIDVARARLDEVDTHIQEARLRLSSLHDHASLIRLKESYLSNSGALKNRLSVLLTSLFEAQETFNLSAGDNHGQKLQGVTEVQTKLKGDTNECKEAYDDLCSHYRFITDKDQHADIQSIQKSIEKVWQDVQENLASLARLATDTAMWAEHYSDLDNVKRSLDLTAKDISSAKEKLQESKLNDVHEHLEIIHSQLCETSALLDTLHMTISMIEDHETIKQHAHQMLKEAAAQSGTLYSDVYLCRKALKKQQSMTSYILEVRRLTRCCRDALSSMSQSNDSEAIQLESIKEAIHVYDTETARAKGTLNICREQTSGKLELQRKELLNEFSYPASELAEIARPLTDLSDTLSRVIEASTEYIQFLVLVSKYHDMSIETIESMNEFCNTVSRPQSTLTLTEIDGCYESLDEVYARFCSSRSQLQQMEQPKNVVKMVDELQESVDNVWTRTKACAVRARNALIQAEKCCLVMEKLSDAAHYLESMHRRLSNMKLSGKGLESEIQELKDMQGEVQRTMPRKTAKIDAIMNQITERKDELQRQRDELALALEQWESLWENKRKDVYEEGDMAVFSGIVGQIGFECMKLSTAVDQAKVNDSNKQRKSDLQALLSALITAYKIHRPIIKELLTLAKTEAQKQYGSDNKRVMDMLSESLAQWAKVQSSAAACERELQSYISQIDHEFFCKLATATGPNTPRKRRDSMANGKGPAPPPLSFVSLPKNTTQEQLLMRRRSKTPVTPTWPGATMLYPQRSMSETSYMPDPTSELDVELGKVINASPFHVKVTMVPGEVGKYWFGEENPRLVYCRILPSQQVMVRVGGGWVELSKYLRDHRLSEGIVTAKSDGLDGQGMDEQSAFQESYLQPLRSTSPLHVPSRGDGGGCSSSNASLAPTQSSSKSSSTRSRSSVPSGYVEGDRFVRIDSAGNQVAIKMTRAEEGARMPATKRRQNA